MPVGVTRCWTEGCGAKSVYQADVSHDGADGTETVVKVFNRVDIDMPAGNWIPYPNVVVMQDGGPVMERVQSATSVPCRSRKGGSGDLRADV